MSTGDPDLDAVMAESQVAKANTGDPDLDAVVNESAASPKETPENDELASEKGASETALSLGTGALASIPAAAAYFLGPLIGKGSLESSRAVQSALTYQPRTEQGKGALEALGNMAGTPGRAITKGLDYLEPSGQLSAAAADVGERTMAVAPFLGEGLAALKGTGAIRSMTAAAPDPTAIQTGHPLTALAQGEAQRLTQIHDRGVAAGLDLPEGGTPARLAQAASNNQPVTDALIRQQLNLPANAPLTPKLIQGAREQFQNPAFKAVADVPEIELGHDYANSIKDVDLSRINSDKYRPPVSEDIITGEQAVGMSRYLRNKANKYFAASKGNPDYEDIAKAHWDAAEALEDATKQHLQSTGQGQLANDWDQARVYGAQTHSVENALDGSGHVDAMNLNRQLFKQKKPFSDSLEDLATLAAQYPQAFKKTLTTAPSPGLLRRASGAAAPYIGGTVGGTMGPWGAAAGVGIGEHVKAKILGQ